ncbi:MAG: hypothetical protein IJK33_04725 [Clostridia bacterium]|nr:hypothetical protein [Clostridia bacterium]
MHGDIIVKKHPFFSGFVIGLIVFFALAAATLLIYPELLYIIREIGKLIAGGA